MTDERPKEPAAFIDADRDDPDSFTVWYAGPKPEAERIYRILKDAGLSPTDGKEFPTQGAVCKYNGKPVPCMGVGITLKVCPPPVDQSAD